MTLSKIVYFPGVTPSDIKPNTVPKDDEVYNIVVGPCMVTNDERSHPYYLAYCKFSDETRPNVIPDDVTYALEPCTNDKLIDDAGFRFSKAEIVDLLLAIKDRYEDYEYEAFKSTIEHSIVLAPKGG